MWKLFRKKPNPKLGLSLGSGGAKGAAHLGVLKAFSEAGIDFDIVTGTSIGSVVGAGYASGMSWEDMLSSVKNVDFSPIKRRGLLSQITMTDSANVEKILRSMFGDRKIEDLKKPFAAVAVDLTQGEEVVFTEGDLCRSLTASSAVAPVFSPVVMGDKHLVDGAYLNPIPADIARALGAEIVISVDLSTKPQTTESMGMIGVMLGTIRIATKNAPYKGYHNSDIVIHPDLFGFSAAKAEPEALSAMFEIGYRAAKEKMPEILELLKNKRYKVGC